MKDRVPEGLSPPAHRRSFGDWCLCHPPASLAGEQADRVEMAHCHLGQVGRSGELSRASQRQGKCKGGFLALPTTAAVTLLAMEGSCSEASGVSCITQNKLGPLSVRAKAAFKGAASTKWIA